MPSISNQTVVRVSLGAIVTALFAGIGLAIGYIDDMGERVDANSAQQSEDAKLFIEQLKNTNDRLKETNALLSKIDDKADKQLERIIQIGLQEGKLSVRLDSLERRVEMLEDRNGGV